MAEGPKGLALGPRPAPPGTGDGAKMLAWPLEDAAEERRPSVVVLPKVDGAKGSAGDGPADGKLVVSERLRAGNMSSGHDISTITAGHCTASIPCSWTVSGATAVLLGWAGGAQVT